MDISDSRDLEDGEYRPTPAPMVCTDIDDPYAMVFETERQPSSNTFLLARFPHVAPISQYFLLMNINGILLATHYGIIGKEKVNSMHFQVKDGLKEILVHCASNFNVVFWTSMNSDNLERHFAPFFCMCQSLAGIAQGFFRIGVINPPIQTWIMLRGCFF